MLHTVRIYLIFHPLNDNVLSLTTIHNEHCVDVLSCLIGIQVPVLNALARYSATQLRMYTIRYARTSSPPSIPRTLLSSGSLLISSRGHIDNPSPTCTCRSTWNIYCPSLQYMYANDRLKRTLPYRRIAPPLYLITGARPRRGHQFQIKEPPSFKLEDGVKNEQQSGKGG